MTVEEIRKRADQHGARFELAAKIRELLDRGEALHVEQGAEGDWSDIETEILSLVTDSE